MHKNHSYIREIQTAGQLLVSGLEAIRDLRDAVAIAVQQLGIRVTWDPSSAPALLDYFGAAGVGALHGAAAGSAFGLVLGLLADDPEGGLKVGAVLGAVLGALYGVTQVERGWRIRLWETDGIPWVKVEVIG